MRKGSKTPESKSDNTKQIRMDVDGCTVKLNLPSDTKEMARIETVKRMILNGVAKA